MMDKRIEKLKELISNKETAKELLLIEKPEDVQKYLAEHGVEMTKEEIVCLGMMIRDLATGELTPEMLQAMSELKEDDLKSYEENKELSDDELEMASGGSAAAALALAGKYALGAAATVGGVAAGAAVVAAGIGVGMGIAALADWAFGSGNLFKNGIGW